MELIDINTTTDTTIEAPQELTTAQRAAKLQRQTRERLAALLEEQRAELESTLRTYQETLAEIEAVNRDALKEDLSRTIASAVSRATDGDDIALVYSSRLTEIITPQQLGRMRADTRPGQLPMQLLAAMPNAGESRPRGPLLLIVDLSLHTGIRED